MRRNVWVPWVLAAATLALGILSLTGNGTLGGGLHAMARMFWSYVFLVVGAALVFWALMPERRQPQGA